MKFGSVCSGIEAASVAWRPLGWEAVFLAEKDAACRSVLSHHYPKTKLYGDFTEIPADAGPIDVLVGGTPCQSFSIAGLRGGLDDDRGNLALEFCRIADRLRPRWFVWENVPGVLSSNEGRDFGSILGAMGELGYGTSYRILDAQHFGVPQRRRRVFVVGHLGDWRRAAAVLFERHSLSGYPPPRREARKDVAPTISARTKGGGGLGTDFDCVGGLVIPILEPGCRTGKSTDDIRAGIGIGDDGDPMFTLQSGKQHGVFASTGNTSHCLNAGGMGRIDYETETLVTHALKADGFDASEYGTGRGTPLVPVAFSRHQHAADASDEVANAILTPTGGRGGIGVGATLTGSAVRRLTPLECTRLQGFPDDYFAGVLHRGKPLADGPIYKMLGNSMAVPCMAWIGERISQVSQL